MRRSSLLLIVSSCLLAATVPAGDLYKWQDEHGVWHFGDRPPGDDEPFETFTVPGEPNKMVTMRQQGPEHRPEYVFFNHFWGPIELEIDVTNALNVRADPPLPVRLVVPGQTERHAVQFEAEDPHVGFQYRLRYSTVPGPPLETLPNNLDFYPPFPAGMEFPISQGIDDATTHNRPGSHYAVDIVMPEGAPVLAARAGLVMDMEEDFHDGGRHEERYIDRANYVRILHDDGSMAAYAHLQPNSARVYPGASVGAGAWIANSGNTGYSSGPHLHFVIQMNAGMSLESLPFRFRLPGGGAVDPGSRQVLAGVLPGPER